MGILGKYYFQLQGQEEFDDFIKMLEQNPFIVVEPVRRGETDSDTSTFDNRINNS